MNDRGLWLIAVYAFGPLIVNQQCLVDHRSSVLPVENQDDQPWFSTGKTLQPTPVHVFSVDLRGIANQQSKRRKAYTAISHCPHTRISPRPAVEKGKVGAVGVGAGAGVGEVG